jgi:hypothetical protein
VLPPRRCFCTGAPLVTDDALERADQEFLNERPEFQRFLLRVIQLAGIFSRTTDGSGQRDLSYDEGRRNLGLEILEMAEAAQPQGPIVGIPASTLTQILLEEARRPKPEKPNGRRTADRHDELRGDDEPSD